MKRNYSKKLMLQISFVAFLFFLLLCIKKLYECSIYSLGTADVEYNVLERMAVEADTDKGSKAHNYTSVYYKYFAPLRWKPIKFLEIGIFRGFSAKLWESYFSRAELHFIDVTDKFIKYRSKRSKFHIFDQSDREKLAEFAEAIGPFDVIIDDGGHTSEQIIESFKILFPFINPGGIYVAEDLHTGYWKVYGGKAIVSHMGKKNGHMELNVVGPADKRGSSVRFFKDLIDEVNFLGANTGYGTEMFLRPELRDRMSIYAKHIESIHFYNSLAFVLKK